MSGPLTFTEFYTDIRSHFATNVWDYEKFKNHCKGDPEKNISGNRAKVEYLMGHAFVQKSLSTLGSTIHKIRSLIFTCLIKSFLNIYSIVIFIRIFLKSSFLLKLQITCNNILATLTTKKSYLSQLFSSLGLSLMYFFTFLLPTNKKRNRTRESKKYFLEN